MSPETLRAGRHVHTPSGLLLLHGVQEGEGRRGEGSISRAFSSVGLRPFHSVFSSIRRIILEQYFSVLSIPGWISWGSGDELAADGCQLRGYLRIKLISLLFTITCRAVGADWLGTGCGRRFQDSRHWFPPPCCRVRSKAKNLFTSVSRDPFTTWTYAGTFAGQTLHTSWFSRVHKCRGMWVRIH